MSFRPDAGHKDVASKPIVHLELHSGDLKGALAFYAEACGWPSERVSAAGKSYLSLDLGDSIGGGIVECETHRPIWLPYVLVEDIHEATDRALLLGARVLLDPREGPAGWRSVVATHTAGEIAFWQPKR